MMTLFPNRSANEIISLMDEQDDLSYRANRSLLEKHGFLEEYYRLDAGRFIGVGQQRILTRLCLHHLNGSWNNTIRFYEDCNRKNDEPHYEDLTTTLLISFAAAFLVKLTAELGKASASAIWRSIRKNPQKAEEIKIEVKQVYSIPVQYVLIGTMLRDQHRMSHPTRHDRIGLEAHVSHSSDPPPVLDTVTYRALLTKLQNALELDSAAAQHDAFAQILYDDLVRRSAIQYFTDHRLEEEDPAGDLLEDLVDILSRIDQDSQKRSVLP